MRTRESSEMDIIKKISIVFLLILPIVHTQLPGMLSCNELPPGFDLEPLKK